MVISGLGVAFFFTYMKKIYVMQKPHFSYLPAKSTLRHMVYINAEHAIKELSKAHRELSSIERGRAIARAMNRTIMAARTASSKEIRALYKVKAKDIKKTFRRFSASPTKLESQLQSTGGPMPLAAFRHSQTKKGVNVTIKGGKRKSFPGAFTRTMRSGHKGVFVRAKYKGNGLVQNHPGDTSITEVKTLAIPSALANDVVTDNLRRMMAEKFPATLAHELKFRSMRAAGLL